MSFASGSPPYRDALTLQGVLMADAQNPETPAVVKAQLARAWKELECLKRVMRGLPANTSQSIKDKPQKRKLVHWQPVEAPDEPDATP
jgi:hypothetical protein